MDASRVTMRVIRTDDELVIACSVGRVLNLNGSVALKAKSPHDENHFCRDRRRLKEKSINRNLKHRKKHWIKLLKKFSSHR